METLKVWIYDKLGVQPKPTEKKKDGFENESAWGAFLIAYIIAFLVLLIVYGIGAGKLSWCYNSSLGTSTGLKALYSFLAFWFSGLYYPYYAFFLDDNCAVSAITNTTSSNTRTNTPRNNSPKLNTRPANQTGGSRRR